MKVTFSSRLFFVVSLLMGLLFAWIAYPAQQTNANLIGGCENGCSGNSGLQDCPSPCTQKYIEAEGSEPYERNSSTVCIWGDGCDESTSDTKDYCLVKS